MYTNIHIIINPVAGQPEPILHKLNKALVDKDVKWGISLTSPEDGGQKLTQCAIQNGADLVVVYGGDGTIKEVMNGLIGSDVPLAILHGGTGNALAHELKIPVDIGEAMNLILTEHQLKKIDVGKVVCKNDESAGHFILRASVGLHTKMLEVASRDSKEQFGNFAYILATIQSMTNSDIQTYSLTVDGEQISGEGFTCMIANSAAVATPRHFNFHPKVNPHDGLLDVFLINGDFTSIMSTLINSVGGSTDAFPEKHWQGREIIIDTEPAQTVTIDGEVFGETPFTATVVPEAVQIIVPKE